MDRSGEVGDGIGEEAHLAVGEAAFGVCFGPFGAEVDTAVEIVNGVPPALELQRGLGPVEVGLRVIQAQADCRGEVDDRFGELLSLDAGQDRARARELARTRIAALDAKIAELEEARSALRQLERECAREGAGPCPIIDAFGGQPTPSRGSAPRLAR